MRLDQGMRDTVLGMVEAVDSVLGRGAAEKNPGLLAVCLQAHQTEQLVAAMNGIRQAIDCMATQGIAHLGRPDGSIPQAPVYVPLPVPTAAPTPDPLGRWRG